MEFIAEFYKSPYFFDSQVIQEFPPVYIEFNKIYRQSEEKFISVLNQVRNNEFDDEGSNYWKAVFILVLKNKDDGYIILTTHNEKQEIRMQQN